MSMSSMSSRNPTTSSLISALAASACLLASVARGEVITTNLSDPNPDGGSFVSSAFPQRAQAFSTTSTGTQISSVKLDVTTSTISQPFSIKLYSTGTSGLPASSVSTLFSGTGGDILFGSSPFTISGLSLNLTPSTQYFVVVEAAGSFSGQWNYNLETTGSGGGFLVDNSLAQTSIDNWQGLSTSQPYRMEIVAVPEPPAIILSGVGLASAIYAMRRRRG
ncbi:MAG: PEP-CTERM sorting domain-containing protein [Planctomycetaceae bacterium]